ncbi:MAG: M61 family peptidase [Cytophagales bacterium]|nr:M61 family peptidase [Cytophagales bacterium]MDW8384869.1 M61 family peptidase [Flammeovirgaceae bacterium]
MKLYLSAPYPHTNFIEIQMHIEEVYEDSLELQLAVWRPGRYELQNYVRYIRNFSVEDENQNRLHFFKINSNRWWIQSAQVKTVIIKYSFYANQLDAGGTYVDNQRWFLNPINFAFAVEGREKEPYEIILEIPDSFKVATALQEVAPRRLKAQDYEELIDSPILAAEKLQSDTYVVNQTRFHIFIFGNVSPVWSGFLADFKAFTQKQLELFLNYFPVKEYYFLIQILPFHIHHGVEHCASTSIVIGPEHDFFEDWFYAQLVELASHELFHVWNIKTIRPVELLPYNYTVPQYFQTCFVVEGVTTYYGDLMLVRSGVFTWERYFKKLSKLIQRHTHHFGRLYSSLAEASFDLWVDGYHKQGAAPYRMVSVYTEGCLAAWLLDWHIRLKTQSQHSLDDVMQILLTEYAQKNIGYTINDYINIISKITQEDASWYLEKYIFGRESLFEALKELMSSFGLILKESDNELYSQLYFGFKFEGINHQYFVTEIHPFSPAYEVLALGDQILSINDNPASQAIEAWLELGKENILTIKRNYQTKQVVLFADGKTQYFVNYSICVDSYAEEERINNCQYWLSGTKPEI